MRVSFPAASVGKRLRPDVKGPRQEGGLSSHSLCWRWEAPREGQRAAPRSLGAAAGGCPAKHRWGEPDRAFRGLGEETAERGRGACGHIATGCSGRRACRPASALPQPAGGLPSPDEVPPPLRPTARPPSARVTGKAGPLQQPLPWSHQAQGSAPQEEERAGHGGLQPPQPWPPCTRAPLLHASSPGAPHSGRVPPPSLSQLQAALHLLGGGIRGPSGLLV